MVELNTVIDLQGAGMFALMARGFFVRLQRIPASKQVPGIPTAKYECRLMNEDGHVVACAVASTRFDALRSAVKEAGIQPEPATLHEGEGNG